MSDETSAAPAARTATEPWKPVPKRRRPKTTEEQLADAMARADALKAKALTATCVSASGSPRFVRRWTCRACHCTATALRHR